MAQTAAQKAEVARKAAEAAEIEAEREEEERRAKLEAQVKANKARYRVIENNLHFLIPGEDDIVVPLGMKTKTYRAMTESTGGGLDQLMEFVFAPLGLVDRVDDLDILDTMLLVNSWFHEFAELQGAVSLGE